MMEAANLTKLGGSIQVPFVQELAAQKLASVPSRYVRPDQDPPVVSGSSSLEFPVIDMERVLSEDSVDTTELNKFHYACKEWGFFQLVNHGVDSLLVEKVKAEISEFFKLPMEEKKKFGQEEGDLEGYGQAFVVSEEQKLDWGDMFYMVTLPTHLRKPHLFSQLPLSFRNTMEVYSIELKRIAMKIVHLIEKCLQIDPDDMKVLFEEGYQGMRINYYPPCPEPDQVIGIAAHSDSVGLTILLQLNEMEGLQVRQNGMWIPVKPASPSAFIVNIGDILEVVTNGSYRSIEHRAVVNSVKERLSIATFLSPKMEGDLGPAPSLLSSNTPPKFKRIATAEYFKGLFARQLVGKSYLDTLRI